MELSDCCQTTLTVPVDPIDTAGKLAFAGERVSGVTDQLPLMSWVDDWITPPSSHTTTIFPLTSKEIRGVDAEAPERVVADDQTPLAGWLAVLTLPFSSQIAVAVPFKSTTTWGWEAPLPERDAKGEVQLC